MIQNQARIQRTVLDYRFHAQSGSKFKTIAISCYHPLFLISNLRLVMLSASGSKREHRIHPLPGIPISKKQTVPPVAFLSANLSKQRKHQYRRIMIKDRVTYLVRRSSRVIGVPAGSDGNPSVFSKATAED